MCRLVIGVLGLGFMALAHAGDGTLQSDPLAKLFGSHPDIRGARLSPDGSKLSVLKTHPEGYTIAAVLDLAKPKLIAVLNSKKDENELESCHWVNETRLLCAFAMQVNMRGNYITATRLMAVNADATQPKLLLEDSLEGEFSQIQTNILDWMGDDPNHVLMQIPRETGTGVGTVDVNTGRYETRERAKERVYSWISDGHGNPRLYNHVDTEKSTWYLVTPDKLSNEVLREASLNDLENDFRPQGFGDNAEELLYFDRYEGRMALFGMNLADENRSSRLVYAHPHSDVVGLQLMGKYDRLVAAIYADEAVARHYFDADIGRIHDEIKGRYPDKNVVIVDEDWTRRNYLVAIGSDTEPGTYYLFDRKENQLKRIGPIFSALRDTELSKMSIIDYPARDGTKIPAYLSLPASGQKAGLPAVILPHGGPSSRDVWGFDFLVQYLTAKGYAVLIRRYLSMAEDRL